MTRCWFVDDHRADYPVTGCASSSSCRGRRSIGGQTRPCRNESSTTLAWRTRSSTSMLGRGVPMGHRGCGASSAVVASGARKRVARIMAELGLVGAHSRKKWRRADDDGTGRDLLERDFTAERRTCAGSPTSPSSRCLRRQALPRRDRRPPRPRHRRLVDGRTPDHRPRRQRPGHGARSPRPRRRARPSRGQGVAIHVGRVHQPAHRLEAPALVRLDRRLLRQRRHGSVLGDVEDARSVTSTATRRDSPAPSCARSCSTTSRSSLFAVARFVPLMTRRMPSLAR